MLSEDIVEVEKELHRQFPFHLRRKCSDLQLQGNLTPTSTLRREGREGEEILSCLLTKLFISCAFDDKGPFAISIDEIKSAAE